MFTLAGFAEDIDPADAEVNITALQDAHLFTTGDDLRIPSLNQLMGVFAGIASGGTTLCRLESPSLRDINRLVINPLNGLGDADVEPSDPPAVYDLSRNPRQLDFDEILQCIIRSNPSAAAFQWALCLLGDGQQQVPSGEIVTVRATGATTVTRRVWSTVTITFADTLPTGRYQVVGLRAIGASMIAARFVFKPGTWRPGCIAADSQATQDVPLFRMGKLGIWGEFQQTQPPDLEVLCDVADTAQTFDLDLIKVG